MVLSTRIIHPPATTSHQNQSTTILTRSPPSNSHLLAQQMNNKAACWIEAGDYSRAVSSLKKALEINKQNKIYHDGQHLCTRKVCTCYRCSLDGSIAFSENNPSITISGLRTQKRLKRCPFISQGRRNIFWKPPYHDMGSVEWRCIDGYSKGEGNPSLGYIYQQPIRVGCIGHDMGSTLFLIIVFNLALAHHLDAVRNHYSKKEQNKVVAKTLALYHLTYKWHLKLLLRSEDDQDQTTLRGAASLCSSVTSIRFNMIIRSNLSQIHYLTRDFEKCKRCLQFLLSTVMVVVEYRSRCPNSVLATGLPLRDPRMMDLDGFLHNTAQIILGNGYCAQAA